LQERSGGRADGQAARECSTRSLPPSDRKTRASVETFLSPFQCDTLRKNKKNGDSLAMDISALAISGGSSSSERTKLDRDLFVEGFGRGKKSVLVDGSAGLKEIEETMDSSPPEGWRSCMAGGRSFSLLRVAVGCVGDVEVVAVVVAVVVVGGGGEVVQVIFLSSLSSSLALVVVAIVVGSIGPQ